MEIFITYKNNSSTFLLTTIQIMNLYFHKTKSPIKENEIHLIALTYMYIHCFKIRRFTTIALQHLLKWLSHTKYTSSQVTQQERTILNELNFNIFPLTLTLNDITSTILTEFAITNSNSNEIKICNLHNH